MKNEPAIENEMLKVLDETVAFYSVNPSERRAMAGMDCTYMDDETGNKCAIGRLLNQDDLEMLRSNNWLKNVSFLSIRDDLTTKKVLDLPTKFLCNLQDLHDDNDYWEHII